SVHPGIAAPGFVSRFSRAWDGIEPPNLFSGLNVPCRNEAANAKLSPGCAGDDLVLDHKGSDGKRVGLFRIRGRSLPEFAAGPEIWSNHLGVISRQEKGVAENPQTTR